MNNLDTPTPEWNLNSYKINFIGQNMVQSFQAFEKTQYKLSFTYCKSIRMAIFNRLTTDEVNKCKNYEGSIPKQTFKDSRGKKRVTWKYVNILEDYIEYVQKLIKDKGLDLSEKGESSLF